MIFLEEFYSTVNELSRYELKMEWVELFSLVLIKFKLSNFLNNDLKTSRK